MMLTAWEEDIGSNRGGFMCFDWVRAVLSIPADKKIPAFVPFGYPVKSVGKGKKQSKGRREVVH